MNQCSAIILNWRRPYHIPAIVESLRRHAFIADIVIWDNSGELPDTDGAHVIRSKRNVCTLGRYSAAAYAKHETVVTQDDDVIVNNFPELYERFDGMRITAGLAQRHYQLEARQKPWLQLGWGSVFKREWMNVISSWVDRYGDDALLESKFDRIFTILYGKHDPVIADYESLRHEGKVSDRDRNSLWKQQNHVALVREATRKTVGLLTTTTFIANKDGIINE